MLSPMSTYGCSSSSSSSRSVKQTTSSLPLDLLHNVLSRLPTIPLLKLRSVCREWRDIIDDRIKTTRILLVPTHDGAGDRHFAVDGEFIWTLMPELAVRWGLYRARASCDGLLCFEDVGVTYLFNPLTLEIVSLTSVDESRLRCTFKRPHLHSIGIGVDRLTSRYKIVRVSCFVDYPEPEIRWGRGETPWEERPRAEAPWAHWEEMHHQGWRTSWAEILDQGSRSWREIGSPPSSLILRDPVFAAGSIHWEAEGRGGVISISSFDIAKEEFAWTPCPELKQKNAHLVDLQGVLGLVDSSCKDSIDVWVMEESGRWMKEYSVRLPLPVEWPYRLDVLGCGGRRIALNRWRASSYRVDAVGRLVERGRLESSWTIYDPASDELKFVQEAKMPRTRAVASITLSLLSPAKLWNSGPAEIRRYQARECS